MTDTAARLRRTVGEGHRLVVKVGSSSLTSADGSNLDLDALGALVDVLAARRSAGHQVVLVSSGAIAAGIGPLGLPRRPSDLATQQAAASVGQGHRLVVGEVGLVDPAPRPLAEDPEDLAVGGVLATHEEAGVVDGDRSDDDPRPLHHPRLDLGPGRQHVAGQREGELLEPGVRDPRAEP